jgi:hypothetical protein
MMFRLSVSAIAFYQTQAFAINGDTTTPYSGRGALPFHGSSFSVALAIRPAPLVSSVGRLSIKRMQR